MCVLAVGLDVSQSFTTLSRGTQANDLPALLLVLALAHVCVWIATLRLVSFGTDFSLRRIRIGASYFLGLAAVYTSLATIVQFLIQEGP